MTSVTEAKFLNEYAPASKYEWMPKTIIYEDGSRAEAPEKPAILLLFE